MLGSENQTIGSEYLTYINPLKICILGPYGPYVHRDVNAWKVPQTVINVTSGEQSGIEGMAKKDNHLTVTALEGVKT